VVLGQITRLAEARLRQAGRRAGTRATLAAAAVLAFLVFLFFGLAGIAVWMAHAMALHTALLVIALVALLIVCALLLALSLEARRHRRLAARRESFDQQLLRTAALAAMPTRLPSRSVTGLGLVAAGALLVLLGRRRRD
jgi:hypothetical protein